MLSCRKARLTGIARMSGTASAMLRNMMTAELTSIESDLQIAMQVTQHGVVAMGTCK